MLALTVALGEVSGVLLILQTAFLARIGNGAISLAEGLPALSPYFIGLLAVIAARALTAWGSRRFAFACASEVKQELRAESIVRLREIGPVGLAGMRAGEISNTVVDAVEALEPYFSRYLPQRAIATLVPFTIVAVIFPLDWISGLVLILTAVFLPFSMIVIGEEVHARNQLLWSKLARMSGRFLDVLGGLATLKMFGASGREAAEIARASEEYRKTTMSVLRIAFVSSFMLELISTVSIAIVAVICGLRLLSGAMSFLPGYFILLIAPEYFLTLRTLGTYYHSRMDAVSAAEHIRGMLGEDADGVGATGSPAKGNRRTGGFGPPAVEFSEVRFSYPGRPVFDAASFSIKPGEHVAMTGETGSGKTTIINLLLGFITAERGSITIDDDALSELEPRAWLDRIAWLPQRPTLFHGTIRENIRLGRLDAGEPEIREAARLAGLDALISHLPSGLYTPVGERGEGLSGGQAQQVALARLFLRNPGLVLLDEPTAHLDEESARLLSEGIRLLTKGRTTILVTHRPDAAEAMDRVLVVGDGGVRALR
jgi:ATP-binding cassette subfamily C protein CydD